MKTYYLKVIFLGVLLLFFPVLVVATNFYVDPVNGSMDNDGSINFPWQTLQAVVEAGLIESQAWSVPYSLTSTLNPKNGGAPVVAGDTLILMSGYHGKVDILKYVNSGVITIRAGAGQTPTLSQLHFQASSNWSVSGLSVSPIYGDTDEATLIRIESHSYNGPSSNVSIDNCKIFTALDTSSWTVTDWLNKRKSGISVDGDNCLITNNHVENVGFGITVSGRSALVAHNTVLNFAGDAMRGLGDYGVFKYNFVANAIKVDENHDDGFQSWSRDGQPVIGVVLRGNQFFTSYNHPNPDLLSTFQGIGCFDGYYEDWLIVNNLVAISHYHGISLYGARNSRIINNTVVDDSLHADDPMVPWIRLTAHKDGSYGEGNVVRNNIGRLSCIDTGVTIDHNVDPGVRSGDLLNYDAYFEDRMAYDFSLKSSAPAVGAGTSDLAPEIDIRGRKRGAKIDTGAYQDTPVLPFLFLLLDQ
jgi:hypothetical protein